MFSYPIGSDPCESDGRVTIFRIARSNRLMKIANDRPPVVLEYQILSVEKSLPEGDYNLLLDWETFSVCLKNGEWLAPVR